MEHELLEASRQIAVRVVDALEQRSFEVAINALAELRPTLDRFFDTVFVMDPDAEVRRNRLCLLLEIKRLFLKIADVSRIQVAVALEGS